MSLRLSQRLLACAAAVVTAAAMLVAQASGATAADSMIDLGVDSDYLYGSDVVAGNDRVYASINDRIVAADSSGVLTGAITGLADADGLAVTPDGTRLYAALRLSNEVAEIDTGSFSITRRFDLAAYPCPRRLAWSGGRLYVGYGCTSWSAGLLGLDTTAAQPEPASIIPRLHSFPVPAAAGSTLVVSADNETLVYDTSGAEVTLRGKLGEPSSVLSSQADITLTSDGSTALTLQGSSNTYTAWDTTSLTIVRGYGTGGSGRAMAVSPDGTSVMGAQYFNGVSSVNVFDAATGENTFTYADSDVEVFAGALTSIGKVAFALVKDASDRVHLWRVPDVGLPASTLTLTAPYTVDAVAPLTLTGQLTLADGSAPGEQRVTVARRLESLDGNGPREPVAEVTTAADGTFTLTDALPTAGDFRYEAVWDGTAEHRWTRAYRYVTAAKVKSSISLDAPSSATLFEPLTLTGQLILANGKPPGEQHLTVTRNSPNGTRLTLSTVTSEDGAFTVTDTPPTAERHTYQVSWSGNATYELSYTTRSVLVAKAPTVLTLTGPKSSVVDRSLEFSGALTGLNLDWPRIAIILERTLTNRNGTVTTRLATIRPASPDGSFAFADTPQVGGDYTYTVRWTGNTTHLPAQASHTVTVHGPID
ncbi:hypothetical protein GCM10022224_089620 [Nonomuraea antimicrobica]|uniref:40-residue YVTN family beta-propeller repeat-containing protein n=1 Tax=Nonomuraea antimicrobica TaxID=561173 RepID=A0ABP7DUK1_9ACTN